MYFPLLSLTTHFMGPGARVKVTDDWKEPVIIWTVVLEDKGKKKSPDLNRLIIPIKKLEQEMVAKHDDTVRNDDDEDDHRDDKEKEKSLRKFTSNIFQWRNCITRKM